MKGSVFERSPGKWAIVLDIYDGTGKRRRKWHTFATTSKRKAEEECSRLIASMWGGDYVEPTKQTVAQFLDEWLAFIKPPVAPKTHERYAEICHKTIAPLIGDVILAKLKTDRINTAFTAMLTSGRRGSPGGVAPRTVTFARRVLIKALGTGCHLGKAISQSATATTPPKVERQQMLAYDAGQTAELIETLRPTRMFIPTLLAVMCGLRRGEIAALRWRNVELGDNLRRLAIVESAEQTAESVRYKEPKSGQARTVALSMTMVEELKRHRVRQAEELLRLVLGLMSTASWSLRSTARRCSRDPSRTNGCACSARPPCLASDSTTCGTLTPRRCWLPACIRRSPASASGIPRSGSRSTYIRTSCRGCRRTRPSRLTPRSDGR